MSKLRYCDIYCTQERRECYAFECKHYNDIVEGEGEDRFQLSAEPFEKDSGVAYTFADRLKNEYKELAEKCEKLGKFLEDKDECIRKVGITQYEMLSRQHQHMNDYRFVVGCRLYELGLQSMKQAMK